MSRLEIWAIRQGYGADWLGNSAAEPPIGRKPIETCVRHGSAVRSGSVQDPLTSHLPFVTVSRSPHPYHRLAISSSFDLSERQR